MKFKRSTPQRPRHRLDELARQAGICLSSIGDVEQLAGITERQALWGQFRHLYGAPTQVLIDAVMDHCSEIALRRITAGELCLVKHDRRNDPVGRQACCRS